MAGIINSGISALNAFKRQLETTGHNIANVNTEGYSRQVVQFQTRAPQALPQGFIGAGVEVAGAGAAVAPDRLPIAALPPPKGGAAAAISVRAA